MEAPFAKSDDLPALQSLIEDLKRNIPALRALAPDLLRVRAVFDSNIVVGDIRWLARATNPAARTATLEAIDAGLITPYAPHTLRTEVEATIEELVQQGARREDVERAWSEYSKRIVFVPVDLKSPAARRLGRDLRDPTDLPFLLAYEAVAADVICSRDNDIIDTELKAVLPGIDLMLRLRDYGRVKAIELKLRVHELAATTFAIGAIAAIGLLVKLFLKAPTWLKVALLAAAALPMLHGPTRERVLRLFDRVKGRLGETWTQFQPHVQRHFDQSKAAADALPSNQQRLTEMLPAQRRITLRAAALAVVAEAQKPIGTTEIAARVIALGYFSRTGRPNNAYLRRVLRSHKGIVEVGQGTWMIRSSGVAP